MKKWIKVASNLVKIARDSNLLQKKVVAKEIFGSNLRLASRAVRGEPQNQWAALCAAHQLVGQKPESEILVHYIKDSSNIFRRRRRRRQAPVICGSPAKRARRDF